MHVGRHIPSWLVHGPFLWVVSGCKCRMVDCVFFPFLLPFPYSFAMQLGATALSFACLSLVGGCGVFGVSGIFVIFLIFIVWWIMWVGRSLSFAFTSVHHFQPRLVCTTDTCAHSSSTAGCAVWRRGCLFGCCTTPPAGEATGGM